MIFKFHKSDTFRRLLPSMITVALFASGVAYLHIKILPGYLQSTSIIHSLLGFVISLLLVFRTNTAYERWWEGRRFWGQLTNVSRNIALKLNAWLPEDHPQRSKLASMISEFSRVLKQQLRDSAHRYRQASVIKHGPSAVSADLFCLIEDLHRQGDLTNFHMLNLVSDLSQFADICGGCERIKTTPIPYSYNLFIKKFIFAYVVTMPFVFVHDFGYWQVLFTTFMFYVLGSLELVAEEVENPFGNDANDLPLSRFSENIRREVHEILLGHSL